MTSAWIVFQLDSDGGSRTQALSRLAVNRRCRFDGRYGWLCRTYWLTGPLTKYLWTFKPKLMGRMLRSKMSTASAFYRACPKRRADEHAYL